MRAVAIIFAALTLSACASECPTDASSASAAATDDLGRHRLPGDRAWMDRVAVSTDNPAIRAKLAELVRENFSVRIVGVPDSLVLVRLDSCSTGSVIGLCGNVQAGGRIIATMEPIRQHAKGGVAPNARTTLEDMFFNDPATQDHFLDFVDQSFDQLNH